MKAIGAGLAVVAAMTLSACEKPKFRSYDGPEVTQILVLKDKRTMYLLNGNRPLKTYEVALGGDPVGDKKIEGDMKTPEGAYVINRRNPNSAYHLSLGISYPNARDVEEAKALGKPPGGDIFIHGRAGKNRGTSPDWTAGCIAVTDDEIEEVYSMVRTGTPIYIAP
ncbi:L,D-transpeptidase family protein [Albidovulum sediminicola]|uniref:L,D-transpeptidase family protein n=1 Tax=Albidovulum sediminicola TaxID=2984331 RepID=A0ABT2YWI3_9RHOB|nr:L,D-transpeptidase family protein [Defluviimonas sp. WL0075]MCV2863219.1 L,D-transpeptidase family protein [Defluviimonas sp. WL0075]